MFKYVHTVFWFNLKWFSFNMFYYLWNVCSRTTDEVCKYINKKDEMLAKKICFENVFVGFIPQDVPD